jgi:4-methyl-5(b-hydroxyethyl)-thiazole monophosphate biosynthesis
MSHVAILLADGFETVEALAVADVARRAGVHTKLVSTMGTARVITGQQVQVVADETLDELDTAGLDCLVLPGGLPAVNRLVHDERVAKLLGRVAADQAVLTASIGAGTMVLAKLGLLAGRRAAALPGRLDLPDGVTVVDADVVDDGNLLTARSFNDSLPFSVALVRRLAGDSAAEKVLKNIGAAPRA